jgi:hypothetical protein
MMINCIICNFFNENTEASEYAEYLTSRLNDDNYNIAELIQELQGVKLNCTQEDLEAHQKNCLPLIVRNEGDQEETNTQNIFIDFSDSLKVFKIKNPIERNGMCDILLNEINFKILYIINEKLNLFKDKIPKDDIQAFKIINDMVAKPDIENVTTGTISTIEDLKKYNNRLLNKLIKSKYLNKEEVYSLMKLLTNKDTLHNIFYNDDTADCAGLFT